MILRIPICRAEAGLNLCIRELLRSSGKATKLFTWRLFLRLSCRRLRLRRSSVSPHRLSAASNARTQQCCREEQRVGLFHLEPTII